MSLKDAATGNGLDLELLESDNLLSESGILSLKLVELLLALSILLSILLADHGHILEEDLFDLELLHFVVEGNFLLLNNALFGIQVVDQLIFLLHLFILANNLIMESFNLILTSNSIEVIS